MRSYYIHDYLFWNYYRCCLFIVINVTHVTIYVKKLDAIVLLRDSEFSKVPNVRRQLEWLKSLAALTDGRNQTAFIGQLLG
jgi:hypothetical protein